MDFFNAYKGLASSLLGSFVEGQIPKFRRVQRDLKMANMNVLLREYLCIIFLTGIFAFAFAIPISFFILFLVLKSLPLAVLFSFFASIGAGIGGFAVALEYPAIAASDRKRNIENNLPFAVLYMNTISGTGAPPTLMFKLLADFKEYGEVSVEAQAIVKDLEVMGQDIQVALERAAERTPSPELKDLFWSMITTIVRGGDMKGLLEEKSDLLMSGYKRKIEEYTNTLSMFVEIYITLVIVGSIFSIVMITIMGAISGFESFKGLAQMIVYVFLPFVSIMFIGLLKATSPVSS